MKIMRFQDPDYDLQYYRHGVEQVQMDLAAAGYAVSKTDVKLAWEAYSSSMCAGWMGIGDPAYNVGAVLPYLVER
jgi:hypothetical protein